MKLLFNEVISKCKYYGYNGYNGEKLLKLWSCYSIIIIKELIEKRKKNDEGGTLYNCLWEWNCEVSVKWSY